MRRMVLDTLGTFLAIGTLAAVSYVASRIAYAIGYHGSVATLNFVRQLTKQMTRR